MRSRDPSDRAKAESPTPPVSFRRCESPKELARHFDTVHCEYIKERAATKDGMGANSGVGGIGKPAFTELG